MGWVKGLVLWMVVVVSGCRVMSDEEAREEIVSDRPVGEWLVDLKEGDPGVRRSAALVLSGAEDSPLLVRELIAALDDESVEVRNQVGYALMGSAADYEEAAVSLARAVRDDPDGAGDLHWSFINSDPLESPAAVRVLVEIFFDPNVSWATLEKAARMINFFDHEAALAALPDDLAPDQREALSVVIRHGARLPSLLAHAVAPLVTDPARSGNWLSKSGPLHTQCATAPWSREPREPGLYREEHFPREEGATPRFTVSATDAETGAAVPVAVTFVRDGTTGALRGRSSGAEFRSLEPPRPGDQLGVYARGYELALHDLTDEETVVPIRLWKTVESFTVGPIRPVESVEDVRAQLRLMLLHEENGRKRLLIKEFTAIEIGPDGTAEVPIPVGLDAAVFVNCRVDGMVWPLVVRAVPGEQVPIHVERPRRTEIVTPGPGPLGKPAVSLDLTARPGWPAHKVDALTNWCFRWEPVFVATNERLFLDAPDAGWHLFARWEGRRFYLRIPAGAAEAVVPLEPVKRVTGRPVVDGEPVPDMTLLAPGRLDLKTVLGIGARGHRAEGYSHAVHPGSRWNEVTLPHSEWLTAWNKEKGIAWLEWKEGETPAGHWPSGRIVIRGEFGEVLTGTARIDPVRPAAGTIRTMSESEPLERSYEDADAIVFSGLATGTYQVYLDLTVAGPGGEPREFRQTVTFTIDENEPVRVFRVK